MIRKPGSSERRSTAHEAVGRAIDLGGEARQVSKQAAKVAGNGCAIYFVGIMAFGLLVSGTPWWFKALILALGVGIYQAKKALSRGFGASA